MADAHSRWNHRWVTPKAAPKTSKVAGIGIIAIKKIAKGETVVVYGGLVIPKRDIKIYHKKYGVLGIQVNDNFFICPPSSKEIKIGALNHSCEPNCGYSDSVTIVAIKDISKGEELLFDYAMSETYRFKFNCNCNSKKCRKKLTPQDWKIPRLQKKYGNYFSPYIKEKINARIGI